MQKSFATYVSVLAISLVPVAASAQDATQQTQTQTQTQTTTTPSPSQTDTSSPLTPTNPDGSSPLTPTPTNPITGQNQQPSSAAAVQSSSEVPSTFVQTPVEENRIDASAPSPLQLEIDPSSSQAALLSPDVTQLTPTAAGVSLNTVQGTTSMTLQSLGSSIPSPTQTSVYPAAITEPAATQNFLSQLSQFSLARAAARPAATKVGSASMGPLIGTAAVMNSSPVESMTSAPPTPGSSTFMRSMRSSWRISPAIASTSGDASPIGPTALRPAFLGSSSMSVHRGMSHSRR